ncbi:reverse transcriptase domain-containing protein [Tanacetum coccineum]|uniref:Reverse transcriptase domain-containing protein n=1 Tax=Tanacetum coccineum TaxID=301880 RepID=A0ABQ5EU40_9ASTR
MHTRSQTRNLHNQQHQAPPPVVEPFNLEEPLENPPPPPPPMDDQRTLLNARRHQLGGGSTELLEKETPSIQTWDDLVVQPPAYQAPAYQAPVPQTQGVSKTDFDSYVKANDAVMRNMQNQNQVWQTQSQNMQAQLNNLATSNQRLESMLERGHYIHLDKLETRLLQSYDGKPNDDIDMSCVKNTLKIFLGFLQIDFLLFEEADSFLALEDDPTSPEVDPTYYDPEGDILLLEAILNSEPSPPLQGNYFPDTRKDLKICEANHENSSGDDKLPVIIAKDLKNEEKAALIEVLKSHKRAIAWKLSDIKGINPEFCTHKILMEEDYEPTVQHQRRVNPKIHDVIKKEVEKLLDAGLIYPISDSPWVSPVHCVPKKGGMTVVKNDENDLIPTRLVTGWRVCIDYRKLNEATRKDHFPLPFMDQMLERLAGNQFYCFLDGFSGYFQIPIDPKDQEKTTFTCPYGTFAYRRMPFGLCNAPGTFQRCMIEKRLKISKSGIEVDRVSYFMVKESIVLGHKISKSGIEIARPMTHLLEKETPFFFSKECIESFNTLKRKLTEAPILIAPDWDLPFELMCDASDFAIGAVLGQRKNKHFQPIHYASKTMTEAQAHYTTTEKELLAVVYAFEKFRRILICIRRA